MTFPFRTRHTMALGGLARLAQKPLYCEEAPSRPVDLYRGRKWSLNSAGCDKEACMKRVLLKLDVNRACVV